MWKLLISGWLRRRRKQVWESCFESVGYVRVMFEEVWILWIGVRVGEIGGEGQRAWKCLSFPLVNLHLYSIREVKDCQWEVAVSALWDGFLVRLGKNRTL